MESLEAELERARELSVASLADAIESIGFECTRCGACCKAHEPVDGDEREDEVRNLREDGATDEGEDRLKNEAEDGATNEAEVEATNEGEDEATNEGEPHTATLFPEEARELRAAAEDRFDREYDWRDVARPMPYGLQEGADGPQGETFEWAIQTDACGDCTFYAEDETGTGACAVHESRPLVCRTYPFSVAVAGTVEPAGEAVDREGLVRAHECEGLGRDIDRETARELAAALNERAVRELEEAIELRDRYDPRPAVDGVVVHDSEGAKRPDGTPPDG